MNCHPVFVTGHEANNVGVPFAHAFFLHLPALKLPVNVRLHSFPNAIEVRTNRVRYQPRTCRLEGCYSCRTRGWSDRIIGDRDSKNTRGRRPPATIGSETALIPTSFEVGRHDPWNTYAIRCHALAYKLQRPAFTRSAILRVLPAMCNSFPISQLSIEPQTNGGYIKSVFPNSFLRLTPRANLNYCHHRRR